tara:strand:+ start:273 stop:455 length:183 start_codon:yes stop_codon:yes gene_type:complete
MKKLFEVHHNISVLPRENYQDYANSMWVEADTEKEAVEIVNKNLMDKFVCHVEEIVKEKK